MHDTRQAILEAARDLYATEGVHALSMRKLADQVGISATAIYRHFNDKEHLILEVCGEGFTLFGAALMKGLRGKTAMERLEMTGEGYLDFALEHPQYYRVMFMSPHPDFALLHQQAQEAFSPTFQFLIDRVSECQRARVIGGDNPEAVAASIWAHVHGAVALWLDGHMPPLQDPEAFSSFFLDYNKSYLRSLAPSDASEG